VFESGWEASLMGMFFRVAIFMKIFENSWWCCLNQAGEAALMGIWGCYFYAVQI
jgi:hypothetical protein